VFEHGGAPYCDRAAAAIELKDLTRVRRAMEQRQNKSGYIRHLYAAVLACWRWAARPVEGRSPERLIPSNPFEGLARPKPGKGKKIVLPWSTIKALVDFAEARAEIVNRGSRRKSRLRALCLRLIADSGCRPKEAVELQWPWLDLDRCLAVIPWQHHKTGFHDEQERFFGFTPETAALLKTHRDSDKAHPVYVFAPTADPRSRPPDRRDLRGWFWVLKKAALAAKVPIPAGMSLYTLRRSFTTAAKKGGLSFKDTTLAMGHSEDVAEAIYDQPDAETAAAQWRAMHTARLKAEGDERSV
jgi:integrase